MSILIRGMEMPQKCGKCKLYHVEHPMHCMAVEGHRTVGAPYGMSRPDWCPLIEIPTPHGRLADLDQIIDGYWDGSAMRIDEIDLKVIEKYDVVIEAEGSE